MIYVTGDTHIPIDIHKLATNHFPAQETLTKEDYVIICGDFGGVWGANPAEDAYWCGWLDQKPFTTLFVDGNHENYDLLNALPQETWHGGQVHRVSDSILHLMRGQIFEIDGKRCFTMGGANSHDIEWRTEGQSWWPAELPSEAECKQAMKTLQKTSFSVDYIFTHTAPSSLIAPFYPADIERPFNQFLEQVKNQVNYEHWFFGHIHQDIDFDDKHSAFYQRILSLL